MNYFQCLIHIDKNLLCPTPVGVTVVDLSKPIIPLNASSQSHPPASTKSCSVVQFQSWTSILLPFFGSRTWARPGFYSGRLSSWSNSPMISENRSALSPVFYGSKSTSTFKNSLLSCNMPLRNLRLAVAVYTCTFLTLLVRSDSIRILAYCLVPMCLSL